MYDKVWREDFLIEAYRQVRRNGGTAGVDGETFSDIEEYGVENWLGELARELKEGSYAPRAVRQVLIPKKQLWQVAGFRHSLPSRPGGAEFGDAGVIADL